MHTQRSYQSLDGVTLVADEAGPGNAHAVILLHGGGQTRHSWSGAMKALVGQGYRVINYDARGHGDSGWTRTGSYSLDDRAADLEAIVAELTQPFAIVGASLGGATAIHAVARGMKPAALVLVDIVPKPEPRGIGRIVGFMRSTQGGFDTIDDAVRAVAAYNPHRTRPSDPEGLLRNLRKQEDGRLYWHYDPRIVSDEPEKEHHAVVQRSSLALADHPQMPVLLVRGLNSDVVSDDGVAAFRAIVPRLEVSDVSGAGHMVSGDRNDAFNTGVISFLDRVFQPGVPA